MTLPGALAFLSGALGSGELLLVALAVLLLFGPRRLPDIARQFGRFMNELRRASREFQDQVMQIDEAPRPPPAAGPPLAVPAVPPAAPPAPAASDSGRPTDHDHAG